jgi:DUF4097 and DUF4098 domain-containing protein YvlB
MTNKRTLAILAAVLLIGATAATASEPYKENFSQSYPLDAKGTVSLENVNGDVTVTAWERGEVKVDAVKQCESKDALDKLKIEVSASRSLVRIETRYPDSHGWTGGHDNCSVTYTVSVPATSQLDKVDLVNGDLKVSGVGGGVRAETVNGTLEARDVTGDLKLESVNGAVDVTCATLGASQRVEIESVNGTIELTLPGQASARLRAETVNGKISNDFGLEVNKHQYVGSDLTGTVGAGAGDVRLETVNGAIRILKK